MASDLLVHAESQEAAPLKSGHLREVGVVFFNPRGEPLERIAFCLQVAFPQQGDPGTLDFAEIEAGLTSVLVKLQFIDHLLKPLPPGLGSLKQHIFSPCNISGLGNPEQHTSGPCSSLRPWNPRAADTWPLQFSQALAAQTSIHLALATFSGLVSPNQHTSVPCNILRPCNPRAAYVWPLQPKATHIWPFQISQALAA
eukprot:gene2839-17740_t